MSRSPMLVLVSLLLTTSCGITPTSRSIRNFTQSPDPASSHLDYQIGPSWGKSPVTKSTLDRGNSVFKRTALATGKVTVLFSSATAFVIGEKSGEVVLATNHHVIEDQLYCDESIVTFEFLGIRRLACDKVLASSTDLDLTIFTVKGLSAEAKASLLSVAKSFSSKEPKKGTQLLTIGYGSASNPESVLMAGQDSDCKTFSEDGALRFMADPDEVNTSPFKVWAYATGCDVSHGDSGSAIVDRNTGDIVGILTTGKIPKNKTIRDQSYLKQIYDDSAEDVWSELTYVVPSSKITEMMSEHLPDQTGVESTRPAH